MNNLSKSIYGEPTVGGKTQIVSLNKGFEARSILLVDSDKPLIFKFIDGNKSEQESSHINLVNSVTPGFFPKVLYESSGDNNFYALEYINGSSLYDSVKSDLLLKELESQQYVKVSLLKLKVLHDLTRQAGTEGYDYWKIIVNDRLDAFLSDTYHCLFETFCSKDLIKDISSISETNNIDIHSVIGQAKTFFIENSPTELSLIHGDSHLRNILFSGGEPVFIDPRVEWDSKPNKNTGFFDPLYDVACLCHSLIIEDMVQRSIAGESFINDEMKVTDGAQALTQHYLYLAQQVIRIYMDEIDIKPNQFLHYMIYLSCSLLGCLKYKQQIVDADMYRFVIYLSGKLIFVGLNQWNGSK